MSTKRDELVTDIMQHPWLVKGEFTGDCPSCPDLTIKGGYNSPSHAGHIADALLADGYRKGPTPQTEWAIKFGCGEFRRVDNEQQGVDLMVELEVAEGTCLPMSLLHRFRYPATYSEWEPKP